MSERNKIEIDYCPSCRGVWLDKGELDKMLDYAVQHSSSENPDQQHYPEQDKYHSHHDKPQHGYNRPHKKKSFLGDLFDFD